MTRAFSYWVALVCSACFFCGSLGAEQHRATHLGNLATRFAPTLHTPEDLRSRFRDEKLKPDFAEVLRQWGWTGNIEDLFRAAATAEIKEAPIAIGSVMPFMSSRENGKAICLRNVTWAGSKPAPAYAFPFTSKGRLYRCVTPKACSNFFLEDLGPEPVPGLALDCNAPAEAVVGRPWQVCLTVRNPGTRALSNAVVRFPIPPGAVVSAVTEGGAVSAGAVVWEIPSIPPAGGNLLCAVLSAAAPGVFPFNSSASGGEVKPVETACSTKVAGISAILIDAVDLEDPVQVGENVTYEIKVTNQGSSESTNVRLLFILPPNEEFVSGGGVTPVNLADGVLKTDALPVLASKGVAVWRVVVKATKAGDVRFKVELTSDQFTSPIHEEESTLLY